MLKWVLLTVALVLNAWAVLVAATGLACRLGGVDAGEAALAVPIAGLLALGIIVKKTVIDEL